MGGAEAVAVYEFSPEQPDEVALVPGDKVGPTILNRCRSNMAHIRQSRPDSGNGFQVKFLRTFKVGSSSLGSSYNTVEPDEVTLVSGDTVSPGTTRFGTQ